MLKQLQRSYTIDEQIQNLQKLKLTINDIAYAKTFLNKVSYFRFVKAYSLGLKTPDGFYKPGVDFDMLVELYQFNRVFRQSLFTQIERIEVTLRCRLSNYFSNKYGVLGYENVNNFQNQSHYEQFLSEKNRETRQNRRSPFIRNFQTNYTDGKIPFYALVEIFTFGTLSKFLKNMKVADKKQLAKSYNINYPYLESWIESLAFVRNVCAHYGRLYNSSFPKTPRLYKEYTENHIGNHRVFASILCMKELLPHDHKWKEFILTLREMKSDYPHVDWKTMDFPENWQTILLK